MSASGQSEAAARVRVACAGWLRPPTIRGGGPSSTTGFTIGALDWGGDGPPLVLLHPNGFCAGVFDPLARLLRGEYRPIGIDLRGHGTSDAPSTFEECGFVAAAGDVVAMLDELGLDEVVLLGESLGGGTGILVDRLRPGLVRTAAAVRGHRHAVDRRVARCRRREPHVGDGPAPAGGVGRPGHGPRVVREPAAVERDGACGTRRLRAVGLPRPAPTGRSSSRARRTSRRGSSSAARDPTARRASFEHLPSLHADVDDRGRRRYRPARRDVRGAEPSVPASSSSPCTARTSSCRRTRPVPLRSYASTSRGDQPVRDGASAHPERGSRPLVVELAHRRAADLVGEHDPPRALVARRGGRRPSRRARPASGGWSPVVATTAATSSPHSSSGTPTRPRRATPGCSLSTSSTSSGQIFSPPELMQFEPRPSSVRVPSASSVAWSPGIA